MTLYALAARLLLLASAASVIGATYLALSALPTFAELAAVWQVLP